MLADVRFGSRNVLEDEGIREGIKKFTYALRQVMLAALCRIADLGSGMLNCSDWPTIPQVFIKGNFVGGCDIVTSMHSSGELKQALADAGVKLASSAQP